MRIKFKAPDPRAGTVAQMDSSRGQHFIDTGAAMAVKEGSEESAPSSVSAPPSFTPDLLDRNAPEVIAWAGDVCDRDQLQSALAAEREGKGRKGVIEALEKALAG